MDKAIPRKVAALCLLAALLAPAAGFCDVARPQGREVAPGAVALSAARHDAAAAFLETQFARIIRRSRSKTEGIFIGGWVVHPEGMIYRIPGEMTLQKRQRSRTMILMDETNENEKFHTTITVSITEQDGRLSTLTPENIKSAYVSQFDRFQFLDMGRVEGFDTEVVRITFHAGSVPQPLFEQLLFERGDRCFIITLMAQDRLSTLAKARAQFAELCDSLFFVQIREK